MSVPRNGYGVLDAQNAELLARLEEELADGGLSDSDATLLDILRQLSSRAAGAQAAEPAAATTAEAAKKGFNWKGMFGNVGNIGKVWKGEMTPDEFAAAGKNGAVEHALSGVGDTTSGFATRAGDVVNAVGKNGGLLGPTAGGLATAGLGIYNGAKAIGNASDIAKSNKEMKNLRQDLAVEAMNDPLAIANMSASDARLLRQLQNGTYQKEKFDTADLLSTLGGAAKGGLTGFLTGGFGGAAAGALGGGANAAMDAVNQNKQADISKLNSLYDRLQNSSESTREMQRNAARSRYRRSLNY